MYPDLSYFFYDLFGTQPDNWTSIFKTFGLFLGLALLSAGYYLYYELIRKEKEGLLSYHITEQIIGKGPSWFEVFSNAMVGFLIAFKIPYISQHFEAFKVDPSSILFNKEGNLLYGIIAGVIVGGLYYWQGMKTKLSKPKLVKTRKYPHQLVSNFIMLAGVFGVLGSKLFSVFENMDAFYKDPIHVFFSGSGLNIFGGLIVAFLALMYYLNKLGINKLQFLDAAAPTFILGYLVGRFGCQFSGDGDWGIVNTAAVPSWFIFPDWLWSYDYPRNVNDQGILIEGCNFLHCHVLSPPVFPTPLYEIIICAFIILIARYLRPKIKYAGMMFFTVLFMNGVERFFVEGIRVNERYELFGMNYSQAQYIAILLIIIGIVGFFWSKSRSPFVVKPTEITV